jgi:hypothetical protein
MIRPNPYETWLACYCAAISGVIAAQTAIPQPEVIVRFAVPIANVAAELAAEHFEALDLKGGA